MKLEVEVPDVEPGSGLRAVWEDGFEISVAIHDGAVLIAANKAGLISLARHLLELSQDVFPSGNHWHFDESNSLEENSSELVISKL